MEENEQKHKRRIRYQGTHPKTYQEKYKELQPDKYPETVEHVIQKGSTPVGMHLSICVQEILDFFQIRPGQIGLDATLGYGGHTQEMLKCLEGQGHIYGLDVDVKESAKTRKRLEALGFGPDILTVERMNFADIGTLVERTGRFDFILADLGVSSMQIDNPERGFSYKKEGPLDLRLDPQGPVTAAQRLKEITREELQGMLEENADETYAAEIARTVKQAQKKGTVIHTTGQLRQAIEDALAFLPEDIRREAVKKSCQRTFQALRIDINREYEVLCQFLETLPDALKTGGKAAILTFHSGEDRLVKKIFRQMYREGIYSDIAKEVIRPSAQECNRNSRAKSTKMRWAVKE